MFKCKEWRSIGLCHQGARSGYFGSCWFAIKILRKL